jgi:DNA polymerase/3'-5' exonuclease PolX
MPAREAERVANRFAALIAGCCEQLVIAGSLRRMRADVGDIEICAVPQVVDRPTGLFAEITEPLNLLDEILGRMEREGEISRRAAGESQRTAWGPYYKRLSFEGYPFDLFTPEAPRFGLILTIRTGPAAWSHQLVTPRGTKTRDGRDGLMPTYLRVQDGWLTERTSGRRIPTPTERDVFDHMQLRWLEPEDRT